MRSSTAGVLAIVVTSVLWGTTGTAAAFAPGASPLAIGSAALGIGGLLQLAIAGRSLRRSMPALRRQMPAIVLGGIAVAIYPLAFYSSMHFAGVAVGSVISLASAPLAAGILERFVDRRVLGSRWLTAAGFAIGGGAALVFSHGGGEHAASDPALGAALGLVAGVTYAVYSWAVRRLMGGGAERAASMGAVFGLGGMLLLPVLVITGAPLLADAQLFGVAAYMALVPMFVGYLLFGYGLARVPASTATTVTLLEPVVATVLAVIVVGEHISAVGWAGMAAIGAALVILTVAPRATEPCTRTGWCRTGGVASPHGCEGGPAGTHGGDRRSAVGRSLGVPASGLPLSSGAHRGGVQSRRMDRVQRRLPGL